MKKILLFLTLSSFGILSFASIPNLENQKIDNNYSIIFDTNKNAVVENTSEENIDTTSDLEQECYVVLDKVEHGAISVDLYGGNVGDIVTITAKHDLLYKIDNVSVNGNALIESDTTSGLYTFALVYGENKITAKFVVDEELCGELTNIIAEVSEKNWTNLFTVENVITLIKWMLDCGILIAIIRYFVKDKKLADKLEKKVIEVTEKIVPESTKNAVVENTKILIEPMFKKVIEDSTLSRELMSIMVKCMVLMQQNTPEAKIAILNEFEKLKGVADLNSIENVKKYIDDSVEKHNKIFCETLKKLNDIENNHKEENVTIGDDNNSKKDNGTQI